MHGLGALGVWHDVADGTSDEIDQWYDREHHLERVAIPGFLRARRYRNLGSGLGYFSRYDTVDAAVLASAPYLQALDHPSPWSRKIFPAYQRTVRGAFQVIAARRFAEGGELLSIRLPEGVTTQRRETLRSLPGRLIDQPGVLGVEIWDIDVSATTPPTRERDIRGGAESFPGAAVLIDASRSDRALEAFKAIMGDGGDHATIDRFRLVYQIAAAHG